jgi:hypothetical protein
LLDELPKTELAIKPERVERIKSDLIQAIDRINAMQKVNPLTTESGLTVNKALPA